MYPYALVGNCQISALIHQTGSVDWLCLPRPDSPPVFGSLLDPEGGAFRIDPCGTVQKREQQYVENTNVLQTRVTLQDGSEFLITDFCPRFLLYGRTHRPNALFRIVEKKRGNPVVQVKCQPVSGWDKSVPPLVQGNSHIRFSIRGSELRLTTNMPMTYLLENSAFALQEPLYFVLSWGFPFEDDLVSVSKDFLEKTIRYWRTWVQYCSIPSQFQKQTIRSALTLKLHCYEDTGAILAATTTSLPEELGSRRNWDYRYCWIRDAYFVLSAFYHLGHFEEMEGYLKFLLNVAHTGSKISPVYRLDHSLPCPETEHAGWAGYQNHAPVRSNNQAAEHVQNDVYGEMILTLAPIYLDERFRHLRSRDLEDLLRNLALYCKDNINSHDAGLWEVRNQWQPHSFTNLLCWAGLDRLIKIQETEPITPYSFDLGVERERAAQAILAATKNKIVRNSVQDESLDAALLLLPLLRFPQAEVCAATVHAITGQLQVSGKSSDPEKAAGSSGFLFRYLRHDDFGKPKSAFLPCSFWLAQALARLGETGRAVTVLSNALRAGNRLGLLSEHFDPSRSLQLGNFPQGYSHVGQINAAFAVSPPWTEVL